MPRSDEAEWWFNAVYEAVQEIPHGHVTSYGHIARLLGKRMSLIINNNNKKSLREEGFSWKFFFFFLDPHKPSHPPLLPHSAQFYL